MECSFWLWLFHGNEIQKLVLKDGVVQFYQDNHSPKAKHRTNIENIAMQCRSLISCLAPSNFVIYRNINCSSECWILHSLCHFCQVQNYYCSTHINVQREFSKPSMKCRKHALALALYCTLLNAGGKSTIQFETGWWWITRKLESNGQVV